MLPPLDSSRRGRHFYRIARIRSESDLVLPFFCGKFTYANEVGYLKTRLSELHLLILESRSLDQRARLGMHFRVWDPPVPDFRPKDSSCHCLCKRKVSLHGQKLPSGHPLEGVSHSTQNYNFERF